MSKRSLLTVLLLVGTTACSAGSSAPSASGPDQPFPPEAFEGLPPQEKLPASTDAGAGDATTSSAQFALPTWKRENVQPADPGFGTVSGLDAYRGKTVVVVLLEGFCPFCRSNAVVAEDLQKKLATEGLDVVTVILGDGNASEFTANVKLPTYRDADKSAWNEMRAGASKHDAFVFAPNGERTFFYPGSYTGDANRFRTEVGEAVRAVAKPK